MTKTYEVVIIGAGIIGSAIGCGLARRGWQTLNIDRHSTSGQGSTSSSVAIVRTHYSTLEGSALAWEGTHCWENWHDQIGAEDPAGMAEFRQTGVLSLKTEENGYLRKQMSVSDELGIPYEEWSVEKIANKLPSWETKKFGPPVLSMHDRFGHNTGPSIEGAVLFPRGGYLPRPERSDPDEPDFITFDNDIGSYTRPDLGNTILAGSEGTEAEGEITADPDDFDRNLSDKVLEPIYRLAQRMPTLGIPNSPSGIVDLWDVSDDWIPIYDRSDLSGFYLAIGTSGNQFKTAPAVGELMAELVIACEAGQDHERDPVQFHLSRIGRTIGLDFFSRNRAVNSTSSFSVLA